MANRPDESVLENYRSEHLQYEWDMLAGTYEALKNDHDQITCYALIESFCIHARNLIEFYRGTGRKDLVKAMHFTRDGSYTAKHVAPFSGEIGETIRRKLDQQIKHMTRERTTDQSKKIGPGDRDKIMEALRKEEARFRSMMDPPMPVRASIAVGDRSATNALTTASLRVLGDEVVPDINS